MGLLEEIGEKIENMIKERPGFQAAVDECFKTADLDGNEKISPKEAAAMVDFVFEQIEKDLKEYGIKFVKPSKDEVKAFLDVADENEDYVLSKEEFFEFYSQVVKYAAVNASKGLFSKYGWSMLAGIISVVLLKRGIKTVPVVGPVTSPILGFVPALIVGPLLGFAARYGWDKGDILALQKKIFSEKSDKNGTS